MAPITRQAAAKAGETSNGAQSSRSQVSDAQSSAKKWDIERDFWQTLTPERRRELKEDNLQYHAYLEQHPEIKAKNERWHQRLDAAAHRLGLPGCR